MRLPVPIFADATLPTARAAVPLSILSVCPARLLPSIAVSGSRARRPVAVTVTITVPTVWSHRARTVSTHFVVPLCVGMYSESGRRDVSTEASAAMVVKVKLGASMGAKHTAGCQAHRSALTVRTRRCGVCQCGQPSCLLSYRCHAERPFDSTELLLSRCCTLEVLSFLCLRAICTDATPVYAARRSVRRLPLWS